MSPEEAFALIEEDIRESLAEYIDPETARFVADVPVDEETPVAEGHSVSADLERGTFAVGWRYLGRQTQAINGIVAAEGQELVIRGATVFVADTEEYHRYVDWNEVYVQLPAASGRRVVDPGSQESQS